MAYLKFFFFLGWKPHIQWRKNWDSNTNAHYKNGEAIYIPTTTSPSTTSSATINDN